MDIYGRNVVQYGTVLILDLACSVSISAVILIGITVHYDLGGSRYNGSYSLNRYCLSLNSLSLYSLRRCTGNNCTFCSGTGVLTVVLSG